MTKRCETCGGEVPGAPNRRYCDQCGRTARLESKRLYEERVRRAAGVVSVNDPISCATCGIAVIRAGGRPKYCEPCAETEARRIHKDANRRYDAARPPRARDPEENKARQARYRERHRERIKARSAAYNEANRKAVNAKARERNRTAIRRAYVLDWERRKARTDPAFVLNRRMKQAVRASLQGGKRGRSWENLVGYTVDDLRRHVERQFASGMTWENIGEWHLDHIVPKVAFTYSSADDPEFRACWALTNLRPLWAADNLSKSAKRLHLI